MMNGRITRALKTTKWRKHKSPRRSGKTSQIGDTRQRPQRTNCISGLHTGRGKTPGHQNTRDKESQHNPHVCDGKRRPKDRGADIRRCQCEEQNPYHT